MLIADDHRLQPQAVIDGTDARDVIPGTDEDDVIDGKGGKDEIGGFGGNDRLIGGAGADFIRGHGGDDRLEGNAGEDRLEGNGGKDDISGGEGADEISGGAGDDVLSGGSGDDTISGNGGDDDISGDDGADTLSGGAGKDVLRGQQGDDRLEGNGGADHLLGGAGDDVLLGGKSKDDLSGKDGDDVLDGGLGIDTLEGGEGRDVFRFTVADDRPDKITDFVQSVDQLDLSDLLPGFAAGDPLDDWVRFDIADGNTLISVDTKGGGSDFVATAELVGVETNSLTPSDLGLSSSLPTSEALVSADQDGMAANGIAFLPDVSGNGRFVSFASDATNLVSGAADDGDDFDVFVKDLETGDVTLVSRGGGQGGDGDLSAVNNAGDAVAFREFAGGAVVLADLDGGGLDPLGPGDRPSISDDGARVAFDGADGVVVAGDLDVTIGGAADGSISPDGDFVAFVRGGGVVLRSLDDGGETTVADSGSDPVVSTGGRFVAYEDGGDVFRVEISDGTAGEPELVSDGVAGAALTPSISNDGRLIAFQSGDDVLVKDMDSGDLQTITRTGDAGDIPDGFEWLVAPSIAGNGAHVAYVDEFAFDGGLTSGQVMVAPVDFGGEAALASVITPSDVVA